MSISRRNVSSSQGNYHFDIDVYPTEVLIYNMSGHHVSRSFRVSVLERGHLKKALLGRGHLKKTVLGRGHLKKAVLGRGHLKKALLGRGHLKKALLGRGI